MLNNYNISYKDGLSKKLKSINRKGAQALRNSPVGYFSAVARLQGYIFAKVHHGKTRSNIFFKAFVFLSAKLCDPWW